MSINAKQYYVLCIIITTGFSYVDLVNRDGHSYALVSALMDVLMNIRVF